MNIRDRPGGFLLFELVTIFPDFVFRDMTVMFHRLSCIVLYVVYLRNWIYSISENSIFVQV
jgi:hypothetical protein